MKVFYIPDGHRRYAQRESISLTEAYERGYQKLRDEVIQPLICEAGVKLLGVFLLSALNLRRREDSELKTLLASIDALLPVLRSDVKHICHVREFGCRATVQPSEHAANQGLPCLDLYVGSDTGDRVGGGYVDLLLRSGGGLRLSGAPRAIVGPYTELMSIPQFHPDISRSQILDAVSVFKTRYMAEPV